MWYLIIAIIIIIFIGTIGLKLQSPLLALPDKFKNSPQLDKLHVTKNGGFPSGKYLHGHPEIDSQISDTQIMASETDVIIFAGRYLIDKVVKVAEIPLTMIKNVSIEDATTFDKRVTLTRVAAIGVFALAAKKNIKNEISYLTIQWNDSRFDHETAFEISANNAVGTANSIRNMIIRKIK